MILSGQIPENSTVTLDSNDNKLIYTVNIK